MRRQVPVGTRIHRRPVPIPRAMPILRPAPVFVGPIPRPLPILIPEPVLHTTRRSFSSYLPTLPKDLWFHIKTTMPSTRYWQKKVHNLLGANFISRQFRRLFGLNDLTQQLETDYLKDDANRLDLNTWSTQFQAVYDKTTGFFGGIKRFLMGLTFFKARSKDFQAAFAELEDTMVQTKFKRKTEAFNSNTTSSLLDAYDVLHHQLIETPIETTVDRDVHTYVAPVVTRSPRGNVQLRPALRHDVHTHITKAIDQSVLNAQQIYNNTRDTFCDELKKLETEKNFHYTIAEEKRQGRLPQKPPRISL